jgi:hypothetical protein
VAMVLLIVGEIWQLPTPLPLQEIVSRMKSTSVKGKSTSSHSSQSPRSREEHATSTDGKHGQSSQHAAHTVGKLGQPSQHAAHKRNTQLKQLPRFFDDATRPQELIRCHEGENAPSSKRIPSAVQVPGNCPLLTKSIMKP